MYLGGAFSRIMWRLGTLMLIIMGTIKSSSAQIFSCAANEYVGNVRNVAFLSRPNIASNIVTLSSTEHISLNNAPQGNNGNLNKGVYFAMTQASSNILGTVANPHWYRNDMSITQDIVVIKFFNVHDICHTFTWEIQWF